MMQFTRSLLGLVLVSAALCLQSAQAQYKQIYLPDTTTMTQISLFDASAIIETGIPGREIAICGSLTGKDSSNAIRQTVYVFQTSNLGEPKQLDLFRDTNPFLVYGPRAYGLAYDGHDNFYVALGSNDNQLVLSMTQDGTFRWLFKGNHHDYYSILMEGEEIVMLGQDESVIGVHDYCLSKLDSTGNPVGNGNMFGTVDFDLPKSVISTPDGYVMCGITFYQGSFYAMVVKADKSFNRGWSQILGGPLKDVNCNDLTAAPDGSGYLATGRVQSLVNGNDSLYVTKFDTGGTVLWSHLYGIDSTIDMDAVSIAADPLGRGYVVAGNYRIPPAFDQPFVMMIDQMGNPLWIRNPGSRNDSIQELVRDIIVAQNGSYYYAVAEQTELFPNNQVAKAMLVIKAGLTTGEIPCDSALTVGMGTVVFVPGGSAHEEPFFASNTYNFFSGYTGEMNSSVVCSVLVSTVPQILEDNNDFSFVNPAQGELVLRYQVNQGVGTMVLNDIHGRIVGRFPMQEGYHEERYRLDDLPQGLYFLTAQGEGWRSETKRLLIVR